MHKRRVILRSAPSSSCKALVLVDASPLKEEERKKCKKLYQTLEVHRKSIELHESLSVPAYQKWFHSQFGRELTEIQILNQQLAELHPIVEAVQNQTYYTGCPEWKAYEALIRLKKRGEELRKKMEKLHESPADSDFQEAEKEFKQAEEEFNEDYYRSAFESFFGTKREWRSKRQSYEEAFQAFKAGVSDEEEQKQSKKRKKRRQKREVAHHSESSNDSINLSLRIKECYRNLARKLHPDLNPGLEPKMVELWHQVQTAYDLQDLSRLETLTALSNMHFQEWHSIEGISALRNLFREIKTSVCQLEAKLRIARKERAWNFPEKLSNPDQLKLFEKATRNELYSQKQKIQDELEELQLLIFSWENPSKKDRRKV